MSRGLSRPVICVVTAGAVRGVEDAAAQEVVALAAAAAAARVEIVQIREPQLTDAALLVLVERVLGVVDRGRTAVLVNERTDVALAAVADGVHLRGDAIRASRVRAVAPEHFLIGRSVHSLAEAREAEADGGVDYVIFGTVFSTSGKPAGHPVAGLARLQEVSAAVRLPVIAIGGIHTGRVAEIAASGAAGIAAIGMFADAARHGAAGVRAIVDDIRHAFDGGGSVV